jgi:hypothetical protein
MKTAMQEWMEWLKSYEYELPLELQIKAKQALEKEKMQIIDAHTKAYLIGEDDISLQDANKASEQYYKQTYNK